MDYKKFATIFNKAVFVKAKSHLITKLAEDPRKYVSIFSSLTPKGKIIQCLLQYQEVKFRDALKLLMEEYLQEAGFKILDNRLDHEGRALVVDQLFTNGETIFLVEQKIRDDHDSSKKRGQIDNFDKKLAAIRNQYQKDNKRIVGIFYFIDDSLKKSKKYYTEEMPKLATKHGIDVYLFYGKELFDKLGKGEIWEEIVKHLERWREDIPEFPEINFDKDAQDNFSEIKTLSPGILDKLFSNPELDSVLHELFPERKTIELLNEWFQNEQKISSSTKAKQFGELSARSAETITRLDKTFKNIN